jgi:hypothetical protein
LWREKTPLELFSEDFLGVSLTRSRAADRLSKYLVEVRRP